MKIVHSAWRIGQRAAGRLQAAARIRTARLPAACCLLSFFLNGCGSISGPIRETASDIFYRDVVRTMEIAQKHGDPQMATCAGFIRQQIDWARQVLEEPTAGLISRAYRDYLAAIEAQGKERAVEEACSGAVGMIAIKALRQMR